MLQYIFHNDFIIFTCSYEYYDLKITLIVKGTRFVITSTLNRKNYSGINYTIHGYFCNSDKE
jgi:hypothetical protein